jgi:hypothetical protein
MDAMRGRKVNAISHRTRFAAALALYVLWVAVLAVMAARSASRPANRTGAPAQRLSAHLAPYFVIFGDLEEVTTDVSPWFGRGTSSLAPQRETRASGSGSRPRLEGFAPNEPRPHVRGHV